MKNKTFAGIVVAILAALGSSGVSAQEKAVTDSTTTAIKLRVLNQKKEDLKKRIVSEDKKRNQAIDGVSSASMERMNLKQDSLCLELRSELVAVELEIRELAPDATANNIIQQYNNLQRPQPAQKKED